MKCWLIKYLSIYLSIYLSAPVGVCVCVCVSVTGYIQLQFSLAVGNSVPCFRPIPWHLTSMLPKHSHAWSGHFRSTSASSFLALAWLTMKLECGHTYTGIETWSSSRSRAR